MIKKATINDAITLVILASKLWQAHSIEELKNQFEEMLLNNDNACFIKVIDSNPVAFAHCATRHEYVEGTNSSPVGYLEGIFVLESYRRKGIAKELLNACEKWAKEKGCNEFASDCQQNNEDSLKFHLAMGFKEVNRIICFSKKL